jgi:hypothetical protein
LTQFLHSPLECNNYRLYNPLPFSHSRYFRIKRNQLLFRFKNNSPYISGDSIAELCDYVAFVRNKLDKLDFKRIRTAKSIFVPGEKFIDFLQLAGEHITAHTLVTGNSDQNFLDPVELPPSVSLWLCQNNAISNLEKVRTLPIGIENLRLGRSGLPKYFKLHRETAQVNRVLVPPMSPTNPIRLPSIFEALKRPDVFEVRQTLLVEKEYFSMTRDFRFVLCCEGNGFENHRIWETLYQGSFPVMFNSPWSNSLRYLQLPIMYIDSLDEINAKFLKDFLDKHLEFRPDEIETLWIPYWRKVIQQGHL